nr:AKH receptor [Aplysia californica]
MPETHSCITSQKVLTKFTTTVSLIAMLFPAAMALATKHLHPPMTARLQEDPLSLQSPSALRSTVSGTENASSLDHTYEVQVVVEREFSAKSGREDEINALNTAAAVAATAASTTTPINNNSYSHCINLTLSEIQTNYTECLHPLPKELYFTDDNAVSVAAYSCLFVVAAVGNLTVFITLFRNRGVKSRINMFIMHLAIADLIVTFMMLPLEIAWHSTVAWKAGDAVCRLLMFFRAMGFYLSSCILVSISLDRYFAIMKPLSISDAGNRSKMMLTISWFLSIVASIPQSIIFHVERHPKYKWFEQCVTFNFFPTPEHELAYNLFSIIALYGLPLVIITSSYCVILVRISKKSRQSKDEMRISGYDGTPAEQGGLRRSGIGNIERARSRTLKMTLVIVGAYVLCWTPYFVISAWYYFDRTSAVKIDGKVQRGLFLFAVSNSCINPIVYGMFTAAFRRESKRWGDWLKTTFSYRGSGPRTYCGAGASHHCAL